MVVKNPALDPNAAGLDELSALPGVYPALAERIIDGRPYLEMDDLLKVNGIGTATLEKLRPLLQIKPKPGKKNPAREVKPKAAPPVALKTPVEDKSKKPAKLPPRVENLSEVSIMHIPAEDAAVVPLSSPVESQAGLKPLPDENRDVQEWPEEIPVSLDDPGAGRVIELNHEISGGKVAVKNPSQSGAQPETPETEESVLKEVFGVDAQPVTGGKITEKSSSPPASEKLLKTSDAISYGIVVSLGLLVISVLLALGIMAAVNRGLSYAPRSEVSSMQRDIDTLRSQASVMQDDISGLRERMAGLETLSGRMSVLEENVLDLQSDLASAQQTVSEFQAKIDEANTRSIMLEERVGLFERFLTGLRDLMNSGFPAP